MSVQFPRKVPILKNNTSSTYCYQVVTVQAVVHVGSTFGEAERAPTQILQRRFSDSLPRHLAAALFRASSSQGFVEPRQRLFREALPTGRHRERSVYKTFASLNVRAVSLKSIPSKINPRLLLIQLCSPNVLGQWVNPMHTQP